MQGPWQNSWPVGRFFCAEESLQQRFESRAQDVYVAHNEVAFVQRDTSHNTTRRRPVATRIITKAVNTWHTRVIARSFGWYQLRVSPLVMCVSSRGPTKMSRPHTIFRATSGLERLAHDSRFMSSDLQHISTKPLKFT